MTHKTKKRFVLIFPALQSVHLHKDVGQIPYQLQKHYGFDAEIVCHKNEEHYNYLNGELKGLNLTFVKSNPLFFLLKNSKKIDILMLFHVKTESIYATLLYKFLNPKGFLYVKYDLDDYELLYASWRNRNFITQLKRSFLFKVFIKKLDLFSVECQLVYDKLKRIPTSKKMHLPNGFDSDIPAYYGIVSKSFAEKENLILLVGRHGSRQKNSELMLNVLESMGDIGDWQVFFIGPMTDEFEKKKNVFLDKFSNYREKVQFVGNVTDKKLLFEYYNRAKIFCLPSRWEGFPLVCPESLFFGNVLVMTRELASSYDITGDGTIGFRAANENRDEWCQVLLRLMNDQTLLRDYSERAVEYFLSHFDWKLLTGKLADRFVANDQRGI